VLLKIQYVYKVFKIVFNCYFAISILLVREVRTISFAFIQNLDVIILYNAPNFTIKLTSYIVF